MCECPEAQFCFNTGHVWTETTESRLRIIFCEKCDAGFVIQEELNHDETQNEQEGLKKDIPTRSNESA